MSTLYVDSIQPKTTGQAITVATTNQSLGKILQVKTLNLPTQLQVTSTSFVTTGYTISITPTLSSSTILLTAGFNCYKSSAGNVWFSFFKDSTNLGDTAGASGAGYGMTEFGGLGAMASPISIQFMDSPSSTSQIIYTVRARVSGSNMYVNSNSMPGNMTVQEIGG
jgi:hypothetical protein